MRHSTNALTARYCKQKGWVCETVQRFYGGRRHDLFGFVDSVILKPDSPVIFAQNCSKGSLAAHRAKIDAKEVSEAKKLLLASGAILCCVEWKRKKTKVGNRKVYRWWIRTQTRSRVLGWTDPSPWEGPLDL